MSELALFLHGAASGLALATAGVAILRSKATDLAVSQAKARSKMAMDCAANALKHADKAKETMDQVHALTKENVENLVASMQKLQGDFAALEREFNLIKDRPPGVPMTKAPWRNVQPVKHQE